MHVHVRDKTEQFVGDLLLVGVSGTGPLTPSLNLLLLNGL